MDYSGFKFHESNFHTHTYIHIQFMSAGCICFAFITTFWFSMALLWPATPNTHVFLNLTESHAESKEKPFIYTAHHIKEIKTYGFFWKTKSLVPLVGFSLPSMSLSSSKLLFLRDKHDNMNYDYTSEIGKRFLLFSFFDFLLFAKHI